MRDRARLATQEQLWLVGLDLSQRLTGVRLISLGTADQTPAEAAVIMRHACEIGAHVIALLHFHVNGAQHPPKPSFADLVMTAAIRKVARSLDILLLDHLIIGRSGRSVSILRRLEKQDKAEAKRKAAEFKRAKKRESARRKPPKKGSSVLESDDGPEHDVCPVGPCL